MTNSWAEANLMHTLRMWRTRAEERGFTRLAELCDYLQADELTHVKLATKWIRKLTEDDKAHRDELVRWGRRAVARIEGFWSDQPYGGGDEPEVHFSFLKSGDEENAGVPSAIIGE